MDDFCKQKQVFLTNDDKIDYTITKSKSHFGLFKKTVNNAFKHVKEYPEVYGMDTFLQEPTKVQNSKTMRADARKKIVIPEPHPMTITQDKKDSKARH